MKPLKEATHDKHKEAERMPFNVAMFKGELTKEQYAQYLVSQLSIFSMIEDTFELPHEGLKRKFAVAKDIDSLNIGRTISTDSATLKYVNYLKDLDQESINAHIYLNYLAIMFGGQMMKRVTPGDGNMYEFEDMNESAATIRAIQKDEWADEVNKGFDFMIEIFKELEKCLTTN
jgi:heme oxygenase